MQGNVNTHTNLFVDHIKKKEDKGVGTGDVLYCIHMTAGVSKKDGFVTTNSVMPSMTGRTSRNVELK